MSYQTTPLFGRQSVSEDGGLEMNISPTQPLNLRASIIKAQSRASTQGLRFSTVVQRITNDKHVSVMSTNTHTSNDTFLTATSQEVRSQQDIFSQSTHPFMAFTKSKDQLNDLDATPVIKEPAFLDVETPKVGGPRPESPKEEHIEEIHKEASGLGLSHLPVQKYDDPITNISDEEEPEVGKEFTFDSSHDHEADLTLESEQETVKTTPPVTKSGDEENLKPVLKNQRQVHIPDENLAYLFIIAIHSFNVSSLENNEDVEICVSFEKDDIAFVHNVDESGWGEVTLIKNMNRGWVPFNYFADAVKSNHDVEEGLKNLAPTRKPLESLLSAAAKFILHPQSLSVEGTDSFTFDIDYVNGIRDGVKNLLQETDCVSRSNDFVQKKPMIKKMRKRLLAEWYNLMIKADSYKATTNSSKIENLVTLTFAVLRKAFLFYEIWWVERRGYELENSKLKARRNLLGTDNTKSVPRTRNEPPTPNTSVRKDLQHLQKSPFALARLTEIHDILFSYFALILGRLDMIEHNPANCEILESVVHQVILLLRELLYISQACSSLIHQKYNNKYENNLDYNLDPLLSLVSELVSSVKVFVTQTINENFNTSTDILMKDDLYFYTDEGEHMIIIISQMTRLISNAVSGCNNYLKLIGDFQLSDERKYPDFSAIRMSPAQFVKKCSQNLISRLDGGNTFKHFLQSNKDKLSQQATHTNKLARFSTIRSGSDNNIISSKGAQLLLDYLPDKKSLFRESQFVVFAPESADNMESEHINDAEKMKDEILTDKNEHLVGISLRALIFLITDEMRRSDDSLLFTVLLNYKSFGSSEDLIGHLISRFDAKDQSMKYILGDHNGTFSSLASRVRSRRRLVCKVIQLWMESFWDYENDYKLIAALINFFNEEVSELLPIEAKKLIEVAARLSALTPKTIRDHRYPYMQLVERNVGPTKKTNSIISVDSSSSSIHSEFSSSTTIDEQFIDKYELTKLPQSSHSTISLPVPILSLGSSSLLTKRNLSDIERIVLTYRDMVGFSNGALSSRTLIPNNNLSNLITEWMALVNNSKNQASPRNFIHNDLNLCELNPLEVAKQLSLIESTVFMGVTPSEILKGKYASKDPDLSKSPNVSTMITITNLLSNYVLESVLMTGLPSKKRANRLKSWLRIALSSLYFRNFNALASIMTTLQSYVISRLSTIWNDLSGDDIELFDYLSRIIHPNNNYKVYRKKLDRLVADSNSASGITASKSNLPVVPFFNLFLQDLTFIDEGNPNFRNPDSFRPNKLINIDKYFKITNIIAKLQFFQVPYDMDNKVVLPRKRDSFFSLTGTIDVDSKSIKPVAELQEFILFEFWRVNTLYLKDSDRGYSLSLELVPRG